MINMLPTTSFQTQQNAQFPAGEQPEKIDLYADLFAALFTVPQPPNVRWTEPLLAAAGAEPGAKETVAGFAGEEKFELPGILPGQVKAVGPAGSFDTKPAISPEPLPPIPARPAPESLPKLDILPPQTGTKKMEAFQIPLGPHDRIPVVVTDVCSMPIGTAGGPNTGGVSMLLPTELVPVDVMTLDDIDPSEHGGVDPLDLPELIGPVTRKIESEVVLETKDRPVEIPFAETVSVVTPAPTTAVKEFVRMPKEFSVAEKRNLEIETEMPQNPSEPTLLETFTANVMVDSRPNEVLRPSTTARGELTEFIDAIEPASVPTRKLEAESGADFSFDSSVNPETAAIRPAPLDIPEEKLRAEVFDQINANISEFAKEKLGISDKREITIRLKPEELGTVEITLAKNVDGVLSAHFSTDNPQTQYLLDQTLTQLRESLESSGVKVGSLETSCSSSFSGAFGGGASDNNERSATPVVGLRTTFDEPLQSDEAKTIRLVNLRA